jgi:hypothetical protein
MFISGWRCVVNDVLEDPGRSLRLGQCDMERRVDTSCGANRQGFAIDSTQAQVFIELIHDCHPQVSHRDVTEA